MLAASNADEDVSLVQNELMKVWESKLEQTMEKARFVLDKDPDFLSVYKSYLVEKYKRDGVCQYCGGKFRGLITKTCSQCGRQKDY